MKTKSLLLALLCTIMCAFHAVAAEGYAVFTLSDHTLTFYYGTKPAGAYSLNTALNYPEWKESGNNTAVTRVVFDPSFAQAKDEARADINGDSKINVSDVTALVNIILGIS